MIKKFLAKLKQKRREKRVIKSCGCICYCPHCKDILNDQADCFEWKGLVRYYCSCKAGSTWNFDIAPVAILLSWDKPNPYLYPQESDK